MTPAETAGLEPRWHAICRRLCPQASVGTVEVLWHIVCALYAWPVRAYHTLDHIAETLHIFDQFAAEAQNPDEVEFALFLHDSVYIPGRTDNEARSAEAAAMMLHQLGCDDATIGRIRTLIMATSHAAGTLSGDAELIADLDMAILGAPEADYDRYAQQVAAEFAFAGEEAFRAGRRMFLESLLAQPGIFRRRVFAGRFEALADRNIRRELSRLR